MKTLRQSLVDYEMALLKAIAACRDIPLETTDRERTIEKLSEILLSPANTAIVWADLSAEEKAAIQRLISQGGQLERQRFARQYGYIRPMGSARLKREKPWQSPATPSEGLWYRGFIFKAFAQTDKGSIEMVYIPDDLLPLLELVADPSPEDDSAKKLSTESLILSQPPEKIICGTGRLRENMFNLLLYLQTHSVRIGKGETLRHRDKEAITSWFLPPLHSNISLLDELEFLLHLAKRAGLLRSQDDHLKPNPDITRNWLQADEFHQVQKLQNHWRADPTWNDLWHVPGLVMRSTGWENSPLLARSKLLSHLKETSAEGDWISLDRFIALIKQKDPDFQRSDGDYRRWYIYDQAQNPLMGFEYWDQIEGALIRYLITFILLLLDVVEIGLTEQEESPFVFRVTSMGQRFFAEHQATAPPPDKPRYLRIDNQFYAFASLKGNLYDRFQLARFTEFERREKKWVVYRITQRSLGRAQQNGVTADQIVAFLGRATHNKTPLRVIDALHTWGRQHNSVSVERTALLRLRHPGLVEELQNHVQIGPLLGEVLTPNIILVPEKHAQKIKRLLIEAGYLLEKK